MRLENLELIQRLEVEKQAADDARERAEQANQAKSRFLAAASHDLRQPIHALGFFLEALSSSAAIASQDPVLDHAKAASVASREMLDILLDFHVSRRASYSRRYRPTALSRCCTSWSKSLRRKRTRKA